MKKAKVSVTLITLIFFISSLSKSAICCPSSDALDRFCANCLSFCCSKFAMENGSKRSAICLNHVASRCRHIYLQDCLLFAAIYTSDAIAC